MKYTPKSIMLEFDHKPTEDEILSCLTPYSRELVEHGDPSIQIIEAEDGAYVTRITYKRYKERHYSFTLNSHYDEDIIVHLRVMLAKYGKRSSKKVLNDYLKRVIREDMAKK